MRFGVGAGGGGGLGARLYGDGDFAQQVFGALPLWQGLDEVFAHDEIPAYGAAGGVVGGGGG